MLLAPSFSPKVQTVLDCLFNAVRALAGRTCPSTSGSFSYSVVLAMPEEACEAPLASQAAGAPQGTHTPAQRRVQHTPCLWVFPWTLAGMSTCRRSLSSVPAPSCCPVGCCALLWWAWQGAGQGQPRSVRGAQTLAALRWPLSCSQLTTTDTSGNHMAQAVAEPFWSRTCFLYFQSCCFTCERAPSSKCVPPYRAENLYRNCVLDHLNRLWFLYSNKLWSLNDIMSWEKI